MRKIFDTGVFDQITLFKGVLLKPHNPIEYIKVLPPTMRFFQNPVKNPYPNQGI